jgi:large subunit ribosomal protein L7Ae
MFSPFMMVYFWTQAPKGKSSEKSSAAKKGSKAKGSTAATSKADPLFPARPRPSRVGGAIRPRGRDLSRFVKWPLYIRIQRQRSILYQRLKVPPAINQFTKTIGRNEAMTVYTLFSKYRPETPAAKKQRIKEVAAAQASGVKSDVAPKVPHQIKFGLKHVTTLIEEKKAELVLIANDVDPIELVMWMPALCRKMGVPFMIVKDKARLGALVHQKTASCLCLVGVNKEDKQTLTMLQTAAKEKFNNNAELVRKWGGGMMGLKTKAKLEKRAKAVAAEEAKKAAAGRVY